MKQSAPNKRYLNISELNSSRNIQEGQDIKIGAVGEVNAEFEMSLAQIESQINRIELENGAHVMTIESPRQLQILENEKVDKKSRESVEIQKDRKVVESNE